MKERGEGEERGKEREGKGDGERRRGKKISVFLSFFHKTGIKQYLPTYSSDEQNSSLNNFCEKA